MVKVGFIVPGTGGSSGGTNDHSALSSRNLPNQHIIGAITGLQEALDALKIVNFQYNDKSALILADPKEINTLYITKDNKVYRYNGTTYIELFAFAENPVTLIEQNDDKTKLFITYFDGTKEEFTVIGASGGSSSLELDTVSATSVAWNSNPEVEINIVDGKISFNFKIPVGASAYDIAVDNGFIGSKLEWLQTLVGATGNDGNDGADGDDGKSAYQIAIDNGFTGTEAEWLNNLIGSSGDSAYDIAITLGFVGTESEWLDSLKGFNGKSAYEVALDQGFSGTENEWLDSLKGSPYIPENADVLAKLSEENGKLLYDGQLIGTGEGTGEPGKSAYQLAVDEGFTGTLNEWLDSLIGQSGIDGKSAYEVATDSGFVGTVQEWLNSLIGADGKSAYQTAVDNGFIGTEQEWLDSFTTVAGKSAYELAVAEGFVGTLTEWLTSLVGNQGEDGKSAYQLAVDEGFNGDLTAWLTSLIGANGKSAYDLAVESGFTGDINAWLESLKGVEYTPDNADVLAKLGEEDGNLTFDGQPIKGDGTGADGKSAYELAVEEGFIGTLQEWITSLNGEEGKSAYQIALDNGFVGTEQEWLDSLKVTGDVDHAKISHLDYESSGHTGFASEVEVNNRMNKAPNDGKIYGGAGDHWSELENVEKRAVILISNDVLFTEVDNVMTINENDFTENDVFTIEYNGAQVTFEKGGSTKILYGIGEGPRVYKFEFDDIERTIIITSESITLDSNEFKVASNEEIDKILEEIFI